MRLLLGAIALLACTSAAAASFPGVGGSFPSFSLQDQHGATVTNADFEGAYAVVEFVRSGDW